MDHTVTIAPWWFFSNAASTDALSYDRVDRGLGQGILPKKAWAGEGRLPSLAVGKSAYPVARMML